MVPQYRDTGRTYSEMTTMLAMQITKPGGPFEAVQRDLPVPGDPDQVLCIYTTEAGSPSETAIRLLANWIHQAAD
jgi:hypothetical protein